MTDPKKLNTYRVRRCNSLHQCCLCARDIVLGELYHDGGWSRRAHVQCVAYRLQYYSNPVKEG